ncbi:SpoIIE family protein phosphatase [Streptomyces sp. JJ36]|uniref:SpoIIE family protein phosphatase n=1 Tax=Streptomyces sp. JJ36 TaxID=2736645 RepID=UPI001F021532|nr:SpoIIE family protein phosphatase [Streptomyces sp. JJ36]MCF6525235.1 SpoIIE family protein phosphatase [Streptomyces sp. JJ36]
MAETGASVGMAYVLEPSGKALRLAVLSGAPSQIAAPWNSVPAHSPVPVADAVRERRLVWLGSREEMARGYPRSALVLPYDFALAAAPVADETAVWGGIVLLWPGSHPHELSAVEHAAITRSCRHLGRAFRQAAERGHPVVAGDQPRVLLPPRTRSPGRGEALAAVDFAERLPEGCCSLDLEGRITFVTATAADLLGAAVPDLLGSFPWEALPWLEDPVAEDRYRAAVISREPVSFTARRPPDRWLAFELHPDASGISVRISEAEAPGGARAAPARAPRAPSRPGPSRATALYQVMHLAASLTEAIGVQDVADLAADQVLPAFGAQGLVLFVAEGDRLRVVGQRGYSAEAIEHFDGVRLSSPPTPAARALATGEPGFVGSPEEMEEQYPGIPELTGKAAWAFLPLVASGHAVGCCVLSYDRPREFPPEERALLHSIAGLLAQALDRARLYDATHALAHRLQAGLLPRRLPQVAGLDVAARYLPASRGMGIGGDFYDLIRLGGTHVAAAIGDVQGHDVTAAALMGQVRTAVHAAGGAPPGEVLARINRLLLDLDPGLFTSCLYADLDLAHHRARLASAGHLPPLLRHPDGKTETLDLPPGMVLGVDAHAAYPTTGIDLPPGAVLALYTDGLIEAPGVDLEECTAELAGRLERTRHTAMDVLAETLLDSARHAVLRNDDIALLLMSPKE